MPRTACRRHRSDRRSRRRAVAPGCRERPHDYVRSVCGSLLRAHASTWRNPKHHAQWKNTLATYVSPVFGSLPVQAVDVGLVMKVLEPIWTAKPDTASRIRGRIESVLNWA